MALAERWRRELDALEARGRRRRLVAPRGHDFSSNDFLGYAQTPWPDDPTLPTSGTASRLLRGHHPAWADVEAELAAWHEAEAALVFSSGYLANEGLLSTVLGPDDWVACDLRNHASIFDGLRLSKAERHLFRHNDVAHLSAGLEAAEAKPGRERFVVVESLYSMDGDVAPLADLVAVTRRFGAHLIVDEAHATGALGPEGRGLVDAAGLRSEVLATLHTGGKALAVPGAYVVGSSSLRDWLVNRCRHLVFTTAPPPRVASWWRASLARTRGDDAGRARLAERASALRAALARRGLDAGGQHQVVPIVLGDDARTAAVAARVQEAGFDVRAIRPPTVPVGTARLRVCVHADHDAALLNTLADVIADAVEATP